MINEILKNYEPVNEQEQSDKKMMLQFIEKNDDYLLRDNLVGHFTSSAIILNEDLSKVLLVHHNIYNSWSWVGGHNDGDNDPLRVAIKEAKEETGLSSFNAIDDLLGIDVVYVKNHIRRGVFVSDHVHMNLTYLLIANELEEVTVKEDENSGVKWFDLETYSKFVDEPRMIPIYDKLILKAKELRKKTVIFEV